MAYRSERRISFGARIFDIFLLATIILSGFWYINNREHQNKALEQKEHLNAVVTQNQSTKKAVLADLKKQLQYHRTILTQLDSVHNTDRWKWKAMDFYGPLIFKQKKHYSIYPCSQNWQDSVIVSKAQAALCHILPEKQDEFWGIMDGSEKWLIQETRNKLGIARNKMHLWVDIEQQTLSMLSK